MKRYAEYILGLMTMAVGVVLMKKAALGITPITSLPLALSEISRISLGNWTIIFHVMCILGIVAVKRRLEVKTALMFPVGIGFGYFIDLLLWLWQAQPQSVVLRALLLVLGIPVSGLGVALINDADLMLPSPDGLIRTIAQVYQKKYPVVKVIGDCTWVSIALGIELSVLGRIEAVGVGTVASALLVGRSIKWFNRHWFQKSA